MGDILPYYSPALSGGGVSENFFKDMMAEMQGQAPGMAGMGQAVQNALDSPSASGSVKADKKDKKKIKK